VKFVSPSTRNESQDLGARRVSHSPRPFVPWRGCLHSAMPQELEHLNQPVLPYARKDFPELRRRFPVPEALDAIRRQGVGEKVIYFYVVDDREKLVGVLPTRRLLTAALEQRLEQVMIPRVVTIPHTATILEACELFVMHRFLAFPVVDDQRRIL